MCDENISRYLTDLNFLGEGVKKYTLGKRALHTIEKTYAYLIGRSVPLNSKISQ